MDSKPGSHTIFTIIILRIFGESWDNTCLQVILLSKCGPSDFKKSILICHWWQMREVILERPVHYSSKWLLQLEKCWEYYIKREGSYFKWCKFRFLFGHTSYIIPHISHLIYHSSYIMPHILHKYFYMILLSRGLPLRGER